MDVSSHSAGMKVECRKEHKSEVECELPPSTLRESPVQGQATFLHSYHKRLVDSVARIRQHENQADHLHQLYSLH